MKTFLTISFLLFAAPGVAQTPPTSPKPAGAAVQGMPHDRWDMAAASPNRNLSDSIGSTWKGSAAAPICHDKEANCAPPKQGGAQPVR